MKLLLPSVFFASAFLGCTTTSLKDSRVTPSSQAPAYDFVARHRDHRLQELEILEVQGDNHLWWKKYRLGLLALEESSKGKSLPLACASFRALAAEPHFPLNEIALLRAHQTCTDSAGLKPIQPELYKNNHPWSQALLAEVTLKQARQTSEPQDDLEALKQSARYETVPRQKEEFLLEALKIAETQKLAEEVLTIQTLLYRSSPRLNPQPSLKDLPAVAMDHRQRREFSQALAVYQKILKDPQATPEERFQARKSIRMTHKVAQNKNAYINATTQLVNASLQEFRKNKKNPQTIKQLHESYILLARTLWTEDRLSLAQKHLNEAQRQLRGRHSFDEIYFILGRMAEEKNQLAKAAEYYQASLKEPLSNTGIRERVLWLHPWVLYKMKNYEAAAAELESFALKARDASDRMRSLFWQARALKNLNKNDQAKTILEQITREDQIGYYGVIAVRELGQSFTPLKSNKADFAYSLTNLRELPTMTALQAEWLMAVGENVFAEKAIDQLAQELRKKNVTDEETWLVVLASYARANLYLPLFAAFNGLPNGLKDKMVQHHPELLFPRDYKELILPAAQNEQIPPEFAFSIIRQESAFNPRARSPADAFGLMQLLPKLGKSLSAGTSIPYREAEDLYDPEINIPLGTKELKNLLSKYDQRYILAVSAYNASASAIRGWLKTRYRDDALEFIEEVPYDETRTYIKLVMRNFVFYKRLGQSEGPVSFPEDWLSLKVRSEARNI